MKKVILDCDCTFGLPGRDVDDGLTLIYLLGSESVSLMGVTLGWGNGTPQEVLDATRELRANLKLPFDYYPMQEQAGDRKPADQFLVEAVNKYPGEITILGTGALTNLRRAVEKDPHFFEKVKQVILMGGIYTPLIINGNRVNELNFSTDPEAAKLVLQSPVQLVVLTGHVTKEAFFDEDINRVLNAKLVNKLTPSAYNYYTQTIGSWIDNQEKATGLRGFCNWDITTAVYLEHPELLSGESEGLALEQPYLDEGMMALDEHSDRRVTMPKHIIDRRTFNQLVSSGVINGIISN